MCNSIWQDQNCVISDGPHVGCLGEVVERGRAALIDAALDFLGIRGRPTNTHLEDVVCYDSFDFGFAQYRKILA